MGSADGAEQTAKYNREVEEATPRDGRAARALRTRQAVAEALLSLLEEGELRPTSRMIAEKAGVSERTIFQHFEDLETLFCVSASRLGDRVFRNLDFISSEGPFEQRLKAYLDELVYLHETVSPVRKASRLHESFSPVLDRSLKSWREALRKGIDLVFVGELSRLPRGQAACSPRRSGAHGDLEQLGKHENAFRSESGRSPFRVGNQFPPDAGTDRARIDVLLIGPSMKGGGSRVSSPTVSGIQTVRTRPRHRIATGSSPRQCGSGARFVDCEGG